MLGELDDGEGLAGGESNGVGGATSRAGPDDGFVVDKLVVGEDEFVLELHASDGTQSDQLNPLFVASCWAGHDFGDEEGGGGGVGGRKGANKPQS